MPKTIHSHRHSSWLQEPGTYLGALKIQPWVLSLTCSDANLLTPASGKEKQSICCRRCCSVNSVLSDSFHPHGLQPTRLLCPWGFPGKNTGVACHFLLQGIFPTQGSNPCLLHWQMDPLPLAPPRKPHFRHPPPSNSYSHSFNFLFDFLG